MKKLKNKLALLWVAASLASCANIGALESSMNTDKDDNHYIKSRALFLSMREKNILRQEENQDIELYEKKVGEFIQSEKKKNKVIPEGSYSLHNLNSIKVKFQNSSAVIKHWHRISGTKTKLVKDLVNIISRYYLLSVDPVKTYSAYSEEEIKNIMSDGSWDTDSSSGIVWEKEVLSQTLKFLPNKIAIFSSEMIFDGDRRYLIKALKSSSYFEFLKIPENYAEELLNRHSAAIEMDKKLLTKIKLDSSSLNINELINHQAKNSKPAIQILMSLLATFFTFVPQQVRDEVEKDCRQSDEKLRNYRFQKFWFV